MEGRETAIVGREAALDPYGPTVIASHPVPDTPANRGIFGGPMSHGGQATPPAGD